MKISLRSSLSLLLVATCMGDANLDVKKHPPPVTDPNLPPCNYMADGKGNVPKYHLDQACDRQAHNKIQKRIFRAQRYNQMLQTGIEHIPDEKTEFCPQQVENWEVNDYGHDTKLIIENEASSPVVLVYVNNGIEYSAIHSHITPPHHDPEAIINPGSWAAVDVYEGHVFYVREITKDGGLGNVLVQHRPGLIPVKNTLGHKLPCEKPKIPDQRTLAHLPPAKQEEIVKQAFDQVDPMPKIVTVKEDQIVETIDPEWDRSHAHMNERCHIMYKGFRNNVDGCAINMFYIGMQEPTDGPMQCREEFKFHLGLHPTPEDYMHSWESRTKFEATFVGHTWVARLASDMNIVVDTHTIQPIYVRDCPDLKNQVKVAVGAEVNGIGEINALKGNTTLTPSLVNITAAAQANLHSI